MQSSILKLSFAYLLPGNVQAEAIHISKEIAAKHETDFTLGSDSFIPHATIYYNEFPKESMKTVLDVVSHLASSSSPVSVSFDNLYFARGYIYIGIELTKDILDIHKRSVEILNEARNDYVREKYRSSSSNYKNYSKTQQKNIEKFGHPEVMSLYHPHVTLTKLTNPDQCPKIIDDIDWKILETQFETVGVFRMGEYGSCQKLLQSFQLG